MRPPMRPPDRMRGSKWPFRIWVPERSRMKKARYPSMLDNTVTAAS